MTTQAAAETLTGNYTIDLAHSRIGFVARHAMVTKVRGAFNELSGSGYLDIAEPANSHLEVEIEAKSIDTRNADRDAHLKSNDFFDMEAHPKISFVSTGIELVEPTVLRAAGNLTIKGVTKPVSIDLELSGPASDPFGNERIGLEGSVAINRKDFGVTWNAALETGGVLVSEMVTIEVEISAIKVPNA